jgi:hypothetical protein
MPKWKANITSILIDTAHHVDDHKAGLMFRGEIPQEMLLMAQYQFKRIKTETETVAGQIEKISAIAKEKGYADILALLDEELVYGFDKGQLRG